MLSEAAGAWADAPPDVWQLVARAMEPRAWARACGAARSLYAARVRIARARPTRLEDFTRRAAEDWATAGSIFLDLRAWADLPSLFIAWDPAACALRRQVYVLPALACLHVVEYGERTLDCEACKAPDALLGFPEMESVRALAVSRRGTARDAAIGRSHLLERLTLPALRVLSLDMVLLDSRLPPTLAGLQHLVLRMDDDDARSRMRGHVPNAPFHKNADMLRVIAGGLPALRTLYIEAASLCYIGGVCRYRADSGDLMPCTHLEALALVNVHVEAAVAVPVGCRVATVLPADAVDDLDKWVGSAAGAGLRARADALVVRGSRDARPALAQHGLDKLTRDLRAARLLTLAELRIVLDAASLPRRVEGHVLELGLTGANLPVLRVLEVDIPCTLRLRLERMSKLRTLVLAAHALAGFLWEPTEPPGDQDLPDGHPWAAISVRIATGPPSDVRSKLHDLFFKSCQRDATGKATFGSFHIQGEGGAWQGAAPAGFIPGDLRACACRACLDCLSRAGLPVAAAQGWRREGFDRLHAPLCT
jgi:hypothetical protein